MAIKESSDELNPAVVVEPTSVASPTRIRSASDYVALAIGTCGVGYFPIAPGTFGSIVGVGIYFLLARIVLPAASVPLFVSALLVLIVFITLIGIWAATRVERLSGRKDPGKVVVDEVAGQLIALLPVIPGPNPSWVNIISAFLLFRLFDIIKPYPARRLESLESGLGIMADDIVAGAYAAVAVSLIGVMRSFI